MSFRVLADFIDEVYDVLVDEGFIVITRQPRATKRQYVNWRKDQTRLAHQQRRRRILPVGRRLTARRMMPGRRGGRR